MLTCTTVPPLAGSHAVLLVTEHGKAEGPVTVEAEILHWSADETNELKVSVSSRPGANHTKLRAAAHVSSCDDMFLFQGDATLDRSSLQGLGVGRRDPMFQTLAVLLEVSRFESEEQLRRHCDRARARL